MTVTSLWITLRYLRAKLDEARSDDGSITLEWVLWAGGVVVAASIVIGIFIYTVKNSAQKASDDVLNPSSR